MVKLSSGYHRVPLYIQRNIKEMFEAVLESNFQLVIRVELSGIFHPAEELVIRCSDRCTEEIEISKEIQFGDEISIRCAVVLFFTVFIGNGIVGFTFLESPVGGTELCPCAHGESGVLPFVTDADGRLDAQAAVILSAP